jgi:hypothetical protein
MCGMSCKFHEQVLWQVSFMWCGNHSNTFDQTKRKKLSSIWIPTLSVWSHTNIFSWLGGTLAEKQWILLIA